MKLFLAHCGFYDRTLAAGIFEAHVDFPIAAEDFADARAKVKALEDFKQRKMHVDGLLRIDAVQGMHVRLEADTALAGRTITERPDESSPAPKPGHDQNG